MFEGKMHRNSEREQSNEHHYQDIGATDQGEADAADNFKPVDEKQAMKKIWLKAKQRLHTELGDKLYNSWFTRLEAEHLIERRLVLSVPTKFLRNWIDANYMQLVTRICEGEFGKLETVEIKVRSCGLPQNRMAIDNAGLPSDNTAKSLKTAASRDNARQAIVQFDASQSFESFVTGTSNSLAHAAALRVADAPPGSAITFNPLYIHSATGLGKTHLLSAIAARIRQKQPERKVLFISAERFMYHFVAALKSQDTLAFKDYFQSASLLLIDDLQFLQGKTMQQEFCHIFTSLVDSSRQVIVAADVPPVQLTGIDRRMRSRLTGGLVVDIQPPELELRRKILMSWVGELRRKDPALSISDDVVEYIANQITGGGRELEGALNRIVAPQQFNQSPMTVEMAAAALHDLMEVSETARVRIDDILRVIGRHYNVPRADLLSTRRARAIVVPRQIGMYLAKKLTPRSLPEIGRRFGGKDHSTVLHAVRKIERLVETDEQLQREIQLLTKLIEQPPKH